MEKVIIGNAELYCADCMDVLPTLGKVDAVITDPPYGVTFAGKATKHTKAGGGYNGGDSEIGPLAVVEALKLTDRAIVFSGLRLMFDYPKPYEVGSVYCPSGAGIGRWGFTVFHPILYYGKATKRGRQSPSGFESFDKAEENGHPCPKPLRWMSWSVNKCTEVDDIVLDPFMGSGTTGVACMNLDRKFIGIEIDRKYFDIACERIERAQQQLKLAL